MINILRITLAFLLLTLGGCATHKNQLSSEIVKSDNVTENWALQARMAFKSPEEKFSATLNWHQQPGKSEFRLSKLIGGTLLLLKEQPAGASLEIDDKVYWDNNATNLIARVTGWEIPVNDIRYWITGKLPPGNIQNIEVKRDEKDRIWKISNAEGWTIDYKNYKVFSGQYLPHNLVIKKENIELKLRVSDWDFFENL